MTPWKALAQVPGRLAALAGQFLVTPPRLVYHQDLTLATPNIRDDLGFGPMGVGDSQEKGSSPAATQVPGAGMLLTVTRPATATAGIPVSVGMFAVPPKPFTIDLFLVTATFRAPDGPADAGHAWAPGVGFRTGGADDLASETRGAVTLQHRAPTTGTAARLNAPGASVPPNRPPISGADFDAIYTVASPSPFTLSLLVHRSTGFSEASLIRDGAYVDSFPFTFAPSVQAASIGTLGASLAILVGDRTPASVTLLEFKVYADPRAATRERAAGLLDTARTALLRWAYRYPRPFGRLD
jgi:hypothetical protein